MNYQESIKDTAGESIQFYFYGHENCLPGHSSGPKLLDTFILKFVKKGRGIYSINDEIYTIKEKTCFMVFPGEITFYKADEQDPWEYYWVGFKGLLAGAYLNSANITPSSPIINLNSYDEIERLFLNFTYQERKGNFYHELFFIGLLHLILAEVIKSSTNVKPVFAGNDKMLKTRYVEKALQFIYRNLPNNISAVDMANYINLERAYFSKIFREVKGISPHGFLTDLRILKAKNLLTQSLLPIEVIALSTGFKNIYYFSRSFKKHTGLSPINYRNKSKGTVLPT